MNAAAPAAPTSFTIPEGKQAVAVQMPFVAGLAGYAKAGDIVNVYGNIDEKGVGDRADTAGQPSCCCPGSRCWPSPGPAPAPTPATPPTCWPSTPPRPSRSSSSPGSSRMWLTLVPKGQPNPPATPGRTYKNAF